MHECGIVYLWMKADDTINIRVVVKGFYDVYLLVGGCLFGFPFGLALSLYKFVL